MCEYHLTKKWKDRITLNPKVMMGKPCINDSRLTVEFILELMSNGWTRYDIFESYTIGTKDIQACLAYASQVLNHQWKQNTEEENT